MFVAFLNGMLAGRGVT